MRLGKVSFERHLFGQTRFHNSGLALQCPTLLAELLRPHRNPHLELLCHVGEIQ